MESLEMRYNTVLEYSFVEHHPFPKAACVFMKTQAGTVTPCGGLGANHMRAVFQLLPI